MAPTNFLDRTLGSLRDVGLLRHLRCVESPQDREITVDGRRVLNFCSNNYLGFAGHPALIEAAATGARRWGTGSGASRLIVGNLRPHERLEMALASLVGTEAALLFNSGYHANLGVIPALVGPEDAVFSDELNHASLIDGCRLSRARIHVYRHADMGHLEQLLLEHPAPHRLIVSEAVFSMDGDTAPLERLAQLARNHASLLMVDEAHSIGLFGEGGGLCAELGVEPTVRMGTLGKSFGSFGAFVAGSHSLRRFLLNRARTFVFTTALPAPVIAATAAAVELCQAPEGQQLRAALRNRTEEFARGLRAQGLLPPPELESRSRSPIFPLIVGSPSQTMECCEKLLELRVFAQGIRPPTVAPGTSRLRFTLMATHTKADIEQALDALQTCIRARLLEPH